MREALCLCFVAWGGLAAWRLGRVPFWLPPAAGVAGLGLWAWQAGWPGLLAGAAGLAAGVAVLVPLAVFGLAAPADVKFLAAVGAIMGAAAFVPLALAGALAACILAAGALAVRRGTIRQVMAWVASVALVARGGGNLRAAASDRTAGPVPVCVLLALGTILALVAP